MTVRIAIAATALAALAASALGYAAEPAAPSTSSSASAGPAVNTSPATPAKPTAKAPAGTTTAARADRLNLGTTTVTGNRELPKVLYIVPWKKADIGELPAQPFNTLLDEVLTPVDRDVFRREVTYYGAISGDARTAPAAASATVPQPNGSEK